jgi:ribonucleoside-diphosphate reductase alpha chain
VTPEQKSRAQEADGREQARHDWLHYLTRSERAEAWGRGYLEEMKRQLAEAEAQKARLKSERVRLEPKRTGFTQEAVIGGKDGVSVCVSTGEYDDGRLGEVFIDISTHENAAMRSWANNFAILLSHALQYGLPLDALVDQFAFTRFEPNGVVEGDANMKMCTSVLDYVFRMLGVHYLKRDDLAQVPPERGAGSGTER